MTLSNRTQIPLWTVESLGSGLTIVSAVIDTEFMASLAIVWKTTSVAGVAGAEISYAVSADGVNFGSFDNVVVANTFAVSTTEDWHETAIAHKARYIKIQFKELRTLADTKVSASLVFTETL